MSVATFPIENTLEAGCQDDDREFWLMAVHGLPPARAKRVLMEARARKLLSDQDCEVFLNAAGLGAA